MFCELMLKIDHTFVYFISFIHKLQNSNLIFSWVAFWNDWKDSKNWMKQTLFVKLKDYFQLDLSILGKVSFISVHVIFWGEGYPDSPSLWVGLLVALVVGWVAVVNPEVKWFYYKQFLPSIEKIYYDVSCLNKISPQKVKLQWWSLQETLYTAIFWICFLNEYLLQWNCQLWKEKI